jgi:hypothetical protein
MTDVNIPRRMAGYLAVLATVAACVSGLVATRDGWHGNIWVVAALCVVAAVAERGRISLSSTIQESI